MEDDDRPRLRSDAAAQLSRESLDTYSQDELQDRIATLEAEIARVKAHHAKADAHRRFADTLFKPRETD
jgi:uncharacterized small protein (DUF1192 family)